MILNKLKINDAKTEFIVFRSPMLKHDLSDLSVNVGGNVIKPSEKVRDLGVILDQTELCSVLPSVRNVPPHNSSLFCLLSLLRTTEVRHLA